MSKDLAGGTQQFERKNNPLGFTLDHVDASGAKTAYHFEQLTTGDERFTATDDGGAVASKTTSSNGTVTIAKPDGSTVVSVEKPDPRFGMESPVMAQLTAALPSGLQSNVAVLRSLAPLESGVDGAPPSVTTTVGVNGAEFRSTFDAALRRRMSATPEGRHSTSYADSAGRPLRLEVPGLASYEHRYDARGRRVEAKQGPRRTLFEYGPLGHLSAVTNTYGQTTRFVVDSGGRLRRLVLPTGEDLGYDYDVNGNVTSIRNPLGNIHRFAYTADGQVAAYTPPSGAAGQILYHYNQAGALDLVTKPDGSTVRFEYDTRGRQQVIHTPMGRYTAAFEAGTGRLHSMTAPSGIAFTYEYDGSLVTRATWTGTIQGSVVLGYTAALRTASIAVEGGATTDLTYDQDGFLRAAGALSLSYDSGNGIQTGATLGRLSSTWAYDTLAGLTTQVTQLDADTLLRTSYERDVGGRITSQSEWILGTEIRTDYTYPLRATARRVCQRSSTPLHDPRPCPHRAPPPSAPSSVAGARWGRSASSPWSPCCSGRRAPRRRAGTTLALAPQARDHAARCAGHPRRSR